MVGMGVRTLLAASAAAILGFGLPGCRFDASSPTEGEELAGGGGIETVGIRGYVFYENGSPAVHARILLRAGEYLADSGIAGLAKAGAITSGETVSDARGFYAIDSVQPGQYRIEIAAEDASRRALVEATVSEDTGLLDLGTAVVRAPGGIQGRLFQGENPVVGAWMHVYGMQRSAITDAAGTLVLADLPEGVHRLVVRYREPYGYLRVLALPLVAIQAGRLSDLGRLELPAACDAARCDSLVVRHLLDANGLAGLPVDSVARWDTVSGRIEALDLSGRGVDTLPYADHLATLKRLELDDNALAYMPPEVTRLEGLEHLALDHNRLRTVPHEIGNLKSLIGLQLHDNLIDSLPPSIGNLASLRFLILGFNQLRSVPAEMGRLAGLRHLNIGFNRLETLPESILELPNLSTLDIDNNRLCHLSQRWLAVLDRGANYNWRAYQYCHP